MEINNNNNNNNMYNVFEVNDCFDDYAMSYVLIGAESIEDLINHLPEIFKETNTKKQIKQIIKEREWRIKPIENLNTDKPYFPLMYFSYFE